MAEESCDEKELICKYFKRRFEYVKKRVILKKHHTIRISNETLYVFKGVRLSTVLKDEMQILVWKLSDRKLEFFLMVPIGDCMRGYRHVCHTLKAMSLNSRAAES